MISTNSPSKSTDSCCLNLFYDGDFPIVSGNCFEFFKIQELCKTPPRACTVVVNKINVK